MDIGITEDPVTGSTHCMIVPLWAEKLGKDEIVAFQASERTGVLYAKLCGNRVKISGKAAINAALPAASRCSFSDDLFDRVFSGVDNKDNGYDAKHDLEQFNRTERSFAMMSTMSAATPSLSLGSRRAILRFMNVIM